MDQLTAYRILQLRPGADMDEIKEAYAELSKEFHPEEHPEEFQRIHEAFRCLMKAARGSRRDRPVMRYQRTENIEETETADESEDDDKPDESDREDLLDESGDDYGKNTADESDDTDETETNVESDDDDEAELCSEPDDNEEEETDVSGGSNNAEKEESEVTGGSNNTEKEESEVSGGSNNTEKEESEVTGRFDNTEGDESEVTGRSDDTENEELSDPAYRREEEDSSDTSQRQRETDEFDFDRILANEERMRNEVHRYDDILSRDEYGEQQSLEDLRDLTEDIRERFQNSHSDEKKTFSERRQDAARIRRSENRRRKENYQRQRKEEARIKDEKRIARLKEQEETWARKEEIRELKRRRRESRGHIGLILNVLIPLGLLIIACIPLSFPEENEPTDTIMVIQLFVSAFWFIVALIHLIITKIRDRYRRRKQRRQ